MLLLADSTLAPCIAACTVMEYINVMTVKIMGAGSGESFVAVLGMQQNEHGGSKKAED